MTQYFRGTNIEQDSRFQDKQAKLLRTMKFPAGYDHVFDSSRIAVDTLVPWIEQQVEAIVGFDDDVVSGYIKAQLEQPEIDPKLLQLNLMPFLDTKAAGFVTALVELLQEAEQSAGGVPASLMKKAAEDAQAARQQQRQLEQRADAVSRRLGAAPGTAPSQHRRSRSPRARHDDVRRRRTSVSPRRDHRYRHRHSRSPVPRSRDQHREHHRRHSYSPPPRSHHPYRRSRYSGSPPPRSRDDHHHHSHRHRHRHRDDDDDHDADDTHHRTYRDADDSQRRHRRSPSPRRYRRRRSVSNDRGAARSPSPVYRSRKRINIDSDDDTGADGAAERKRVRRS